MIDVRSDTVTRPGPAMLQAMMQAQVGDDVFGEDETVNALQRKAAELFGKDGALFCPSGTMSNQIGIKLHTQPGDEVICDQLSHIYLYEGGGIAVNSSASVRLLQGHHGRFTAAQVLDNINQRGDSHYPNTRLVRISQVCEQHQLALHLDGARLFNALVARNEAPRSYGELFHTISICLSKGLGAPAGSLLLGSKEYIGRAHRLRKLFGGGMRQAGYLAAAGLYALEHNIERLQADHRKARALDLELKSLPYVAAVLPVETNIVIFTLQEQVPTEQFLAHLRAHDVRASSIGPRTIRFVFHLDVSDAQFDRLVEAMRAFR
jgi:threonine aldolase